MAYALIVAAGRGERSGLDIPKQFFEIYNRPVLAFTLDVFLKYNGIEHIAVALPEASFEYYRDYMEKHIDSPKVEYIQGGASRMESVFKGLEALCKYDDDVVLIHDGVRMFVTEEIISNAIDCCRKYGAALTAVKMVDTVKLVEDGIVKATCDREKLYAAQTPQTFKLSAITDAYKKAFCDNMSFTDDCAVAEYSGIEVHVSEGSVKNIKLTVKEDFENL